MSTAAALAPSAPPLPRRWRQGALGVALATVVAAVFGFGGVHSSVWVPCCSLAFAGLAALVVAANLRGLRLPCPGLLLPMAVFGLLVCVQWAFRLSQSPSDTLNQLIPLAAGGAVFYLGYVGLSGGQRVRPIGLALWLLGGALAVEAIVQRFALHQRIYGLVDASYASPFGPFYYHNHYAGCMDLLIPVGLGYVFSFEGNGEAAWVGWIRRGLLPALAIVSVVLSNSRGGVLSLGLEALAFLVFGWRRLRSGLWPLAAGVATAVLGLILLSSWQPLLVHLGRLDAQDPSVVGRLDAAEACVRIFRHHPWIGVGFGAFASVYPQYQRIDQGVVLDTAHDEYAQTLAETGLVGMTAVGLVLGLLLRQGWRWFQGAWSAADRIRLGAFVGCLGFLAHSVIDFQFHAPANLWLFSLLVALVMAPPGRRRLRRSEPEWHVG